MGDPVWYEVRESTGRVATWHGSPDAGNLLFLDGSVRFVPVEPRPEVGAAVFDPLEPGLAFPLEKR
jgi:prepilin-type processing-associated H-X9-DG protein